MKSMDVQKLWRPTGLLLMVLLVSGQALARDGRNLAVNQVNNAVSEQRIALVIGNGAYTSSPLKNPVNDAQDIAAKLRGLGFNVIERNNLQTRQIGATLREFRSKLVPGAVALVFYAGHGLQIKGINYLPAVDAEINSEEDVPNQSIAMNQIMDVLDESKTRLNLVFLDACRNNPYARSFRSTDKGLARVSAPSGTLISYATRPGSIAADGGGRNGLYTSKLLAQMDSNLQIEQALKRVVTEVKAASQGKQEPWMEGSIEGDFCFAGCAAGSGAQVSSLEPVPAPVGGSVSLDDIKKQQETRGQWGKWQVSMKADFDKIAALNAEPELQVTAWDRFLANYAQDNPYSAEDKQLRAQAQSKKQTAQTQQQQATARLEQQKQEAERKQEETPKGYVSQGGLTWMPIKFAKPWSVANSYCDNTAINGQTGWRLPTKDELRALYASGVMNGHGWTVINTWSSTPYGSGYHYLVNLDNGNIGPGIDTNGYYVSCVR